LKRFPLLAVRVLLIFSVILFTGSVVMANGFFEPGPLDGTGTDILAVQGSEAPVGVEFPYITPIASSDSFDITIPPYG